MAEIEEVKRILKETIANYEKAWQAEWIEKVAQQICQLFEQKISKLANEVARLCQEKSELLVRLHEPKPDEGRLLRTDAPKVKKLLQKYFGVHLPMSLVRELFETQDAETAPIAFLDGYNMGAKDADRDNKEEMREGYVSMAKDAKIEGRLLTEEEAKESMGGMVVPQEVHDIWWELTSKLLKAQRDLTASIKDVRYKQAVKDSIDGKPLDLTEVEFEVFCSIENMYIDRIFKVKDAEGAKILGDSVKAWHERLKEKDAEFEKKCKECEYDPQAAEFGWFIDHGWLPPGEVELFKAECQARAEELEGALQVLVDKYWRNQEEDYDEGFISCITPNNIPDYWKRARQALKEKEVDNEPRVV